MKAVVLAGGEGSRLRPLTSRRPKPLVPVAGRPIMEHILTLLRDHGITEVVVTLQYLGSEIRNYFGDGSDVGLDIHYVVEDHPLGTAGSVRNAAELLDDTFVVISGDALTDIDLSWVIAQHREKEAMATIVLHGVPNPLEYGVVITEPDGAVRRFLEKPSWGEVFSDQANTGIYVIEPRVLDYIKPGMAYDWSQDVFPTMLRRRDPLYGVVPDGYWCDVGTIQSYLQANWDALEGRVRCQVSGRRDGQVWVGEGVEFGLHVRIDGPVYIGSDAKIKAGAFINGPVVIDKYTVIDDNAKVSNSVLWQHSYIGENCRLRQSIVGRNVTIKNNCLLEENTVVGDDCVIGEGSRIDAGVKLWPNKEIQTGSRVNESIIWAGEWRPGLFSADGLTGLINVELTPEYCARLGAAFAATHPKGATIAVTRDCARSSRMINRALIAGIVSAGGRVLDRSELPVPVTQYACRLSGCAAGVHVLASPLDQRSADIRFFDANGLPIDKRAERKVENLFFREDIRRVGFYEMGDIEYASPRPAYIDHVLAGVDVEAIRAAGLRVVVDYDYSAASLVLPDILNQLGIATVPLHAGFSEDYRPRPADQLDSMLEELGGITRTLGADFGCLLSATGERLLLVDENGGVLSAHEALGVLTVYALDDRRGEIIAPASAPQWLNTLAGRHGGCFRAAKSDASTLLRAAVNEGTALASDGRGGFGWPHQGAFDAMYTLTKLLELRSRSGRPLSSVRAEVPRWAHLQTQEFCPWEAKGRVMRILLEQHRDEPVDLTDGIKVFVEGGYVLMLPDPDRPYYHVIASVEDEAQARTLLEDYSGRVRAAQQASSSGRSSAGASVLEKGASP
ncbi:MAG: mannose-phosphate guanylyltransferase / phosphomannomutase, partial [Chloroflexota bacterium]|nr:mannose-phosphate guanylyltransferase / phosphomannomutase [Chloroflexota bacterium]